MTSSRCEGRSKAFVVNRIGDAGSFCHLPHLHQFQTLDYTKSLPSQPALAEMATAIALCLLVGAVGKSAQLPLYTWLRMRWKSDTRQCAHPCGNDGDGRGLHDRANHAILIYHRRP